MRNFGRKLMVTTLVLIMTVIMCVPAFAATADLADGEYKVTTATLNNKMFKVIDCKLIVKNGDITAELMLGSDGYYALSMDTAANAINQFNSGDESSWIKYDKELENYYSSVDSKTQTRRVYTVPVSSLEQSLAIASCSQRYYDEKDTTKMWYDRVITFDLSTLVPVDGEYTIDVETGEKMFKVVDAVLKVKDGKMTAVITLSGTGYTYLYAGAVDSGNADPLDTVDPADRIGVKETVLDEGKEQYQYEVPVASLSEPLAFGAFSANKQTWYARTLTFKADTLVAIPALELNPITPAPATVEKAPNKASVPKTGDDFGFASILVIMLASGVFGTKLYRTKED